MIAILFKLLQTSCPERISPLTTLKLMCRWYKLFLIPFLLIYWRQIALMRVFYFMFCLFVFILAEIT